MPNLASLISAHVHVLLLTELAPELTGLLSVVRTQVSHGVGLGVVAW